MMKYILLAYRDEKRWEAMSEAERRAFEEECQSIERELVRGIHLLDVQRLQIAPAILVRMVDGELSLTSGGQEQLVQLLLIQARDLNAAIQIASKMPQARGGLIEVRSIVEGKA